MSANADLITVETHTTSGNNLKTTFSFMGQNVKTIVYFWLFGGRFYIGL